MTTASASRWYTILQVADSSRMRNSWHPCPMEGIGRDWGSESVSPRCNLLNSRPASSRAALENGGVLTSDPSHTSGLSAPVIQEENISDLTYTVNSRGGGKVHVYTCMPPDVIPPVRPASSGKPTTWGPTLAAGVSASQISMAVSDERATNADRNPSVLRRPNVPGSLWHTARQRLTM